MTSFVYYSLFRNSINVFKRFKINNSCSKISVNIPNEITRVLIPHHNYNRRNFNIKPLLCLSVLGWLGLEKPKETIQDELIMNIKWGILLLQRKDYKKSENMFHLALRMAQQLHNQNAITYIYDMMANLAMETEQYAKAEKLFISVMERLLGSGYSENHIKNIHISLKISRCNHMSGNLDKASIGYRWVINNLEEKKPDDPSSPINKLLAIAKDWYGHCLYEQNHFDEAMKNMTEAFHLLKQLNNEEDLEEIICLINDIATIYDKMNDIDNAIMYLKEAIRITRDRTEDLDSLSVLYINLGRVFIRANATDKAHRCCTKGLNLAKATKNEECLIEAKNCLTQIMKNRK